MRGTRHGVYDPAHFNDRLLLGLKGTMSEAELHILRARLRGGILNKARRGELEMQLPTGFVYDEAGQVQLDPDAQVREAVLEVFRTFRPTGSASKTVKAFREAGRKFPRRVRHGASKGEVVWGDLRHHGVLRMLHHPRYAGAFCFGRHRVRRLPNGKTSVRDVPEEEWIALIRDSHKGYITWEEYRENAQRLKENARGHSDDRKAGPPREGPALLQGIVLCGVCGDRMTVRYHQRDGQRSPGYVCQGRRVRESEPICQAIPGKGIDEAIGKLVVGTMTPWALEVALTVEEEIESRAEEAARMRQHEVERLRHEVELARRRYMRVDPGNRLVADSLEADWNEKLRSYNAALEREQEQDEAQRKVIDEACRAKILQLAVDFPKLFKDSRTPDREHKRMIRLLIEDVTLRRGEQIAMDVRFRGRTTRSLQIPLPLNAWQRRLTKPNVVKEIDRLLDDQTCGEIAEHLDRQGLRSGEGKRLTRLMVYRIARDYLPLPIIGHAG